MKPKGNKNKHCDYNKTIKNIGFKAYNKLEGRG